MKINITGKKIAEKCYVAYVNAKYGKAKPLPFYFLCENEINEFVFADDRNNKLTKFNIFYDKNNRPYLRPNNDGNFVLYYEEWWGNKNYYPKKYERVAILSEIFYSNGGGAGEYWAVLNPVNLHDDDITIYQREILNIYPSIPQIGWGEKFVINEIENDNIVYKYEILATSNIEALLKIFKITYNNIYNKSHFDKEGNIIYNDKILYKNNQNIIQLDNNKILMV